MSRRSPRRPSFSGSSRPGSAETRKFNSDEIADIIREQIWPNPLPLYYGEVVSTQVPSPMLMKTEATLRPKSCCATGQHCRTFKEPTFPERRC